MALRNKNFGPPPVWFYDVYDAISQRLPLGNWPSIAQQPFYIRYRYRFVNEALKENRMKYAIKVKAQGVIDLGNL